MEYWLGYTVKDAARILRMNEEVVRRYIRAGKIKAKIVGGKYMMKKEELNKMLEG